MLLKMGSMWYCKCKDTNEAEILRAQMKHRKLGKFIHFGLHVSH